MRSIITTNTNTKIEYPDVVAWLMDNNFIHLKQLDGYPVKAQVEVVNMQSYYLNHTSEIDNLTFRLNPLLRAFGPATVTIKVTVWSNGQQDAVNLGKVYVYHGKTLQERFHGSAVKVPWVDASDLASVDFYNPFSGMGGTTSYISTPFATIIGDGISQVPVSNITHNRITNSSSTVPIGTLWNYKLISNVVYAANKMCPVRNGIKLRYYDTDGCIRHVAGEVLKKTMKVTRQEYHRGGTVCDEVPRSIVTDYAGTMQVGFSDVPNDMYIEDIMLSPYVEECLMGRRMVPTTLTLDRDYEDTKDVIINFLID